ncbi:hypothetical protein ACWGR3_30725, partial [Streptomyces albidoflavus]
DDFLIEYGGQFGLEGAADTLIPPAWWERAAVNRDVAELGMPSRFSAAMKVHHLGTHAALAVAWDYEEESDLVTDALALTGEDKRPQRRAIAVWLHQTGTEGFARDVIAKMKRKRLWFDDYGHTAVVAKTLAKSPLKPELKPTKPAHIPLSAVGLMQSLEAGTVVHFRQGVLDTAAGITTRQTFGQYGSWRLGPPKADPEADICALEAAALALHFLDDEPQKVDPKSVMEA